MAMGLGVEMIPCRVEWEFSKVHVMLVATENVPVVAPGWESDDEVLVL